LLKAAASRNLENAWIFLIQKQKFSCFVNQIKNKNLFVNKRGIGIIP
jgi:hypothetical protein